MLIILKTLNINNLRTTSASLSTCIPLEIYQIFFKKRCSKGNVYSHRFWDIAVPRKVGIITRPAGYPEWTG